FAAEAEFAGDVNAWLVGKGHAGFEDGLAAADEVGMLVTVEADAVTQAMSEEFVVGAEAAVDDDGAGSSIDSAGEAASACGVERSVLRLADEIEYAQSFVAGLAEDAGAGDVGCIAFDAAAAVDQHHVTFAQCARLDGTVGERSRFADEHQRAAAQIHL